MRGLTQLHQTMRGLTQQRAARPCLRWLATSPASQATTATGEAANETCTTAPAPYTATSLWQSQEATANQIENMKPDRRRARSEICNTR